MSEMEKKDMADTLVEEDLEKAAGGKTYIVNQNRMMFCPYCKESHNISVLRGKHLVGDRKETLYRCNRHESLFVVRQEGCFNENGVLLMCSGTRTFLEMPAEME